MDVSFWKRWLKKSIPLNQLPSYKVSIQRAALLKAMTKSLDKKNRGALNNFSTN
jgi:hypothetical protein